MTLQTQTPTCILKLRALQLAYHRLNPPIVQYTHQIMAKKKKKTIARERLAWKWCVGVRGSAVRVRAEKMRGWERKRLTERWERKGIKKSLKFYNIYSYASIFESVLFINIKYFDI